MKVPQSDFDDLCDLFTQSTLDELTKCPVNGLRALLIERTIQQGFAASWLYFSRKALQEFQHLDSRHSNIFDRWIKSL